MQQSTSPSPTVNLRRVFTIIIDSNDSTVPEYTAFKLSKIQIKDVLPLEYIRSTTTTSTDIRERLKEPNNEQTSEQITTEDSRKNDDSRQIEDTQTSKQICSREKNLSSVALSSNSASKTNTNAATKRYEVTTRTQFQALSVEYYPNVPVLVSKTCTKFRKTDIIIYNTPLTKHHMSRDDAQFYEYLIDGICVNRRKLLVAVYLDYRNSTVTIDDADFRAKKRKLNNDEVSDDSEYDDDDSTDDENHSSSSVSQSSDSENDGNDDDELYAMLPSKNEIRERRMKYELNREKRIRCFVENINRVGPAYAAMLKSRNGDNDNNTNDAYRQLTASDIVECCVVNGLTLDEAKHKFRHILKDSIDDSSNGGIVNGQKTKYVIVLRPNNCDKDALCCIVANLVQNIVSHDGQLWNIFQNKAYTLTQNRINYGTFIMLDPYEYLKRICELYNTDNFDDNVGNKPDRDGKNVDDSLRPGNTNPPTRQSNDCVAIACKYTDK
ncbi:hypothetical protein HT594_00097 [Phenacoccus solenopsis nudivirus]|nr:hypothetical protein HT594_00097 [Phenacoccus solenopsis nudivirus]